MEKTIENLRKNGFTVTEFDTRQAAADYLVDSLHGKTIGMGGSMTMAALNVYDRLAADNTVYWHQVAPGPDTTANACNAQVYIASANAVSEEGFILNIDGRGNRVAGTLMAKERVIFVVGRNKLAGPMAQALDRARNTAAPLNAKRLNKNTPCAMDGRCHDCASPDRICNALVVLWKKPSGCEDMEVVVVDEELGY